MKNEFEGIIDESDFGEGINTPEELVEFLERMHPNEMVLDEISEFERVKLAGKVELIIQMKNLLKSQG